MTLHYVDWDRFEKSKCCNVLIEIKEDRHSRDLFKVCSKCGNKEIMNAAKSNKLQGNPSAPVTRPGL